MIPTAVLAALASACGFALSNSLQHRVASNAAYHSPGVGGLLGVVARRPSWHVGVALGLAAVAMQGVALNNAPLFIVQPVVVGGIVMAVPIRAALDNRLPSRDDLMWVAITAVGIAGFVVISSGVTNSEDAEISSALVLVLVGAAAATAMSGAALREGSAHRRGILLGAASGILSGLTAGTLKLAALDSTAGLLAVATVGGVLVLGGFGFALNQRAYQVAPLSLSLPVLNVVGVAVATAFGYAVFGEVPAHRPSALAAEVAGMVVMGLGLTRLVRRTQVAASSDRRQAQRGSSTSVIRLADWPTCEPGRGSATVRRVPLHCCSLLSPGVRIATPTIPARSLMARRRRAGPHLTPRPTRPATPRPAQVLRRRATVPSRWRC